MHNNGKIKTNAYVISKDRVEVPYHWVYGNFHCERTGYVSESKTQNNKAIQDSLIKCTTNLPSNNTFCLQEHSGIG